MEKKIVIDTNIFFSALLMKGEKIRKIIFESDKKYKFYSCNQLFIEIFLKKEKILNYCKNPELVPIVLSELLKKIEFINEFLIPKKIKTQAYELCKEIDETDTPFIALTIFLNGYLWTGDKKLITHLKNKGFKKFFQ